MVCAIPASGQISSSVHSVLLGLARHFLEQRGKPVRGVEGVNHVSLITRQGRHKAATLAGGCTAFSWSRSR